ncbi:MAG: WD40/YVTN/BNR-like repeat-containing protein [Anaerolineales bacterium]
MSKKIFALLLISILLTLSGCGQPQLAASPTAADTQSSTITPPPPPTSTENPPTSEPSATAAEPTLPPTPTIDLSELLSGPAISHLAASQDLTIHQIQMITSQVGWAITRDDPSADHILITNSGGQVWKDVTPPQPLNDSGMPLKATAGFLDQDTAFVNYTGSEIIWTTSDGGASWQPGPVMYQTMAGGLFSILDNDHAWLFQFLDAGMQKVYTAISRTEDGGQSWETILDPYSDSAIQGFDKTGTAFIDPQFGWLTRDFRGVAIYVYLDITQDGGLTWQQVDMPAPPSASDAFSTCACGLYDPALDSEQSGSVRLTCKCYPGDTQLTKNFLYQTSDGGASWDIQYVPEGDLHRISDQVLYLTDREIYRSTDSGVEWDLVKSVNWDGQFSFISEDLAWAVAYDPTNDVYALVKTADGCSSFQIIQPQLVSD